jgi:hypothetical protein
MPEINEADKEALTAALVVLQRKGVPSDTLEMLTHGDGRGTIAPGALNEAIRAALRAPSHIGLADEEVALAMILRPFMECCEQFCPCATPHKGCQCRNAAVAISAHLRAQRKASDEISPEAASEQHTSSHEHMASVQTCAAGSVPHDQRIREIVSEGDGVWRTCSGCHESEDGHDVGLYSHSDVYGCKLGGGCSECGGIGAVWDTTDYEDMGRELSASPSPPVIESGECGLTYQHYRTPDEVARRWKHALDLHREHVEHLFSEYEKGTISLGEVKHRAMMLISPISDQDLRLATDEAVGIAEELHRESQTVGGEKADA